MLVVLRRSKSQSYTMGEERYKRHHKIVIKQQVGLQISLM